MKNLFLLCLFMGCLSLAYPLQAQSKQEVARTELQQLRQSFLLVRLQTKSRTIEALEKQNMLKQAEEVRREQYNENKGVITAFQHTFNFCPVYFFYADDSDKIRRGELAGNIFNADLERIDSSSAISARPFFTAEFSETEDLGISALIIMDDDIVPLQAPFPYFERQYIFFSLIEISKGRMAEKLNSRLHETYNMWFQ